MKRRRSKRSGNVLLLTVVMMAAMFAMLAFAVDLGYVHVVRTQLQNSADAAALGAAWELIDEGALSGTADPEAAILAARSVAAQYAAMNPVTNQPPALALEDVEVGYLANPWDDAAVLDFSDPGRFNAVRVRVRRTAGQNGEVPLFFAPVLGKESLAQQAEAVAMFVNNIGGFTSPPPGQTIDLLPFALDKKTWDDLLAGVGSDNWTWDETTQTVSAGADGILEANLFPQGTGSPGNRGTVDIGNPNNSTADLARQIVEGIDADDLAWHGGTLEFNEEGKLYLNGDTGISGGMKDELASIIGQPRIILIFETVSGNGNNATYTIVQFAGVRIMEVKLTGRMSSKRVIVQPAVVKTNWAIPDTSPTPRSYFVYSPVWLVR